MNNKKELTPFEMLVKNLESLGYKVDLTEAEAKEAVKEALQKKEIEAKNESR